MSHERESEIIRTPESSYDQKWLAWNMYLFARLARIGFEDVGPGAVVVNLAELILRAYSEQGHPFTYLPATSNDWSEDEALQTLTQQQDIRTLMQSYHPDTELVAVLLKSTTGVAYRISLPTEPDLEIRGCYVKAEDEEMHHRVTCTHLSAGRDFRLASPFLPIWSHQFSELFASTVPCE